MRKFNFFKELFGDVKNTKEIPELTKFLVDNHSFKEISQKFHGMKLKAW